MRHRCRAGDSVLGHCGPHVQVPDGLPLTEQRRGVQPEQVHRTKCGAVGGGGVRRHCTGERHRDSGVAWDAGVGGKLVRLVRGVLRRGRRGVLCFGRDVMRVGGLLGRGVSGGWLMHGVLRGQRVGVLEGQLCGWISVVQCGQLHCCGLSRRVDGSKCGIWLHVRERQLRRCCAKYRASVLLWEL